MLQDELQVILIQGYLVEKGYARIEDNFPLKVNVELEGQRHEIVGRMTIIVPHDVRVVPLFSPNGLGLASDMEEKFMEAASELVKSGKKFGTSWRKTWGGPIIVWEC